MVLLFRLLFAYDRCSNELLISHVLVRCRWAVGAIISLATATASVDSSYVTNIDRFNFEDRYTAAYHLAEDLPPAEINALVTFLVRRPADDNVGEPALASIKNNVADKLIQQRRLPTTLLSTFYRIVEEPAQGSIWREYVVQKMGDIYSRLNTDEEKQDVLDFLAACITPSSETFPTTAVLALVRIDNYQKNSQLRTRVVQGAQAAIRFKSISAAHKGSLLQVLKEYDPPTALVIARETVNRKDAEVPLRISAIATLGDLGADSDRNSIEVLTNDPDPRVKSTAIAALRRLDSKK